MSNGSASDQIIDRIKQAAARPPETATQLWEPGIKYDWHVWYKFVGHAATVVLADMTRSELERHMSSMRIKKWRVKKCRPSGNVADLELSMLQALAAAQLQGNGRIELDGEKIGDVQMTTDLAAAETQVEVTLR